MTSQSFNEEVNGLRIAWEQAGSGYPLLLLHGFPRDRKLWSRVMPGLADSGFSAVAMDLRGYGESEAPSDETAYDKRSMAEDALSLARRLGWDRFVVVGHDRGASVARSLAADHPEVLDGAVIMDILPMEWSYNQGWQQGQRLWHWYLFLQRGFVDELIGGDPRRFFSLFLGRRPHLSPEEMERYVGLFSRPSTWKAALADYRMGFEVDRPRWEAERAAGKKVQVPVLYLWGQNGPSGDLPALDLWKEVVENIRGAAIEGSGHYIPEQQPEAVVEHIGRFARELGLL